MPKHSPATEAIWFQISGAIGTLLFYAFYEGLYRIADFEWQKAAVCNAIAYAVSIIWQHALHRTLVFGATPGVSYWRSLGSTYLCYGLSIALLGPISVALDFVTGNHQVTWVLGLVITGAINYFTVKQAFAPPKGAQLDELHSQ
ncbi:hypothetical protein CAOG_01259 [Capsaspora owczarzaki ATCC 30864]|uniref:GtrA/DPMS transmembrane domain-containing protein n=1 Tax=Capsaspora owczarzaki (strain ATCC 30864) TaxID=595528 RepID=A0A0D2WIU2_CAPO3|nr:hypothetical protein CAOG_01259 [Capsaspora owczarzaki ATCC 30864]KJE89835.1 hypothetical protein CAOG_001259 [Capsaspora owczarzaki ATCC 30864]|eukprot:XP_004349779.1 hypothetical protein CAOG_01259 [Capsaspora owczarzaki ATCC 30864]